MQIYKSINYLYYCLKLNELKNEKFLRKIGGSSLSGQIIAEVTI